MDVKGALSRNLSLKIQTKGTASKLGETLNISNRSKQLEDWKELHLWFLKAC